MYCSKCGDIIEQNEMFCNKCGNPLNNSNNQPPVTKNYLKMVVIGLISGITILVVLLSISLVINNTNNFYISSNPYDNNLPEQNYQNQKVERKSKYSTVIIADNYYEGVNIKNGTDANDLIIKDSVSQKVNCPKEIVEIENEIINKYNITAVNLCELDLGFAKELEKVFEYIYKDYPSINKNLTNFSVINAKMSEGYIAAFAISPFAESALSDMLVMKTQILLNTSYFFNKEKLEAGVISSSKNGHFPPNATIYSPLAHEIGHYISFLSTIKHYDVESILLVNNETVYDLNQVIEDWNNGTHSLKMIEEAFENYKKDNTTTQTLDEWRGTISNYALAKDNNGEYIYDETIAEAFHDVYLNNVNAKPASKYIVEVLKQKVEGI